MQNLVIKLLNPTPGQHDNIHGGQVALLQAHGFTDQPLEAVAIDGTANVFLANDQPETWMAELIGRSQRHHPSAMDLVSCLVEDIPIRPGIEQAKAPGEALTRH